MVRISLVAVACAVTLLPLGASAEPVGNPFLVNTYNFGGWQESPAVAADPDGNFVAVWRTYTSSARVWMIHGQRYDAGGARLGAEFAISTSLVDGQSNPRVAMAADHTFVVVWSDDGPNRPGIVARRFDLATGGALTPEFMVSASPAATVPSVAVGPNDSAMFVWLDNPGATSWAAVMAQRYDRSGEPLGPTFQVGQALVNTGRPTVASDGSGNVTFVWRGFSYPASIAARRYDADGNPLGAATTVYSSVDRNLVEPSLAMNSSGRFAIAWTTYAVDSLNHPIDYQVGARIYASSGAEVTGALAVNTPQLMGRGPAVAVDASGKILVAWQRDFATGYGGVIGRWYTASGTALGGEFTAHPFYADAQAALVATGTGRFVAVWKGTGLTGGSIWGQLLQMPADLVVSGLASPALAASGASFSVTTKILNQGGDPPQEPSRNSVGRPAPRRPPQTPSWPRSRLRHSILTMPHRRP